LEHWKCVDQSRKAALSLVLFPSFDTHLQILICVLPSPAAIQVPKTDHSCGTITCIAECYEDKIEGGWSRRLCEEQEIY
jgi:hypothetical protein